MANEGNAIAALAIGAAAGYALWHFFGDKILARGPAAPEQVSFRPAYIPSH